MPLSPQRRKRGHYPGPSKTTSVSTKVSFNIDNYLLGKTIHSTSGNEIRTASVKTENGEPSKSKLIIKIYSKSRFADDGGLKRRITQEVHTLEACRHPNIVELVGTVQTSDALILIFPHLAGGDLASLISARGHLECCEAQKYTAEIISALMYLQHKGRCHGNLNPSNMLIGSNGKLVLVGFSHSACCPVSTGMPEEISVESDFTFNEITAYLAPECFGKGQMQDKTIRADIWSVGIVIYQMLTGKPPKDMAGLSLQDKLQDSSVMSLLDILLVIEPRDRASLHQIREHSWLAGHNALLNTPHVEHERRMRFQAAKSKFGQTADQPSFSPILKLQNSVMTRPEPGRGIVSPFPNDSAFTAYPDSVNSVPSEIQHGEISVISNIAHSGIENKGGTIISESPCAQVVSNQGNDFCERQVSNSKKKKTIQFPLANEFYCYTKNNLPEIEDMLAAIRNDESPFALKTQLPLNLEPGAHHSFSAMIQFASSILRAVYIALYGMLH